MRVKTIAKAQLEWRIPFSNWKELKKTPKDLSLATWHSGVAGRNGEHGLSSHIGVGQNEQHPSRVYRPSEPRGWNKGKSVVGGPRLSPQKQAHFMGLTGTALHSWSFC